MFEVYKQHIGGDEASTDQSHSLQLARLPFHTKTRERERERTY